MNEHLKAMPANAVWDFYCEKNNVPVGVGWLAKVKGYETKVLSNNGKELYE